MSTITLDMLTAEIAATNGDKSPAEQGQILADAIIILDRAQKDAARAAAKPARKPARKVATIADPAAGTGSAMRMTLAGRMMPTDKLISDRRRDAITAAYTPAQIKRAGKKLGFAGKSLKTLSVADASDLYTTLKAA